MGIVLRLFVLKGKVAITFREMTCAPTNTTVPDASVFPLPTIHDRLFEIGVVESSGEGEMTRVESIMIRVRQKTKPNRVKAIGLFSSTLYLIGYNLVTRYCTQSAKRVSILSGATSFRRAVEGRAKASPRSAQRHLHRTACVCSAGVVSPLLAARNDESKIGSYSCSKTLLKSKTL
jgi:hypothetical protein